MPKMMDPVLLLSHHVSYHAYLFDGRGILRMDGGAWSSKMPKMMDPVLLLLDIGPLYSAFLEVQVEPPKGPKRAQVVGRIPYEGPMMQRSERRTLGVGSQDEASSRVRFGMRSHPVLTSEIGVEGLAVGMARGRG